MPESITDIFTTTEDVSGLLPGDYGSLIVQPVSKESVAFQVSTVITTDSTTFHAPVITEDGTAEFYTEGADLTGEGATFDELTVTPVKVGRVVPISNELADDSTPEATELVGQSIARAIATKIDQAYFGNLEDPAPKGLESIEETKVTLVDAGTEWINTDPFTEAIAELEQVGAVVDTFVAHPADYKTLLKLKRTTDSNEPLLGVDATQPTRRTLLGVPLLASAAVTEGTVWGIDKRYSLGILRKDVTLEVSREHYFSTDKTAVKATLRVGFGYAHPKAIAKIKLGEE